MGPTVRIVLSQKGAGRGQRQHPLRSSAGQSPRLAPSVMNHPPPPRQRPEDELLSGICSRVREDIVFKKKKKRIF